jgi:hypothetical protein
LYTLLAITAFIKVKILLRHPTWRYNDLSGMRGNSHVPFLEGWVRVIGSGYSTTTV